MNLTKRLSNSSPAYRKINRILDEMELNNVAPTKDDLYDLVDHFSHLKDHDDLIRDVEALETSRERLEGIIIDALDVLNKVDLDEEALSGTAEDAILESINILENAV